MVIKIEKHLLYRRLNKRGLKLCNDDFHHILFMGYVLTPHTVWSWETEGSKLKSLVIGLQF